MLRLRERGFDTDSPVIRQLIALTRQLIGMPRHLSQHVGGFVISGEPLAMLVPIENAAMPERTIIQWDKDDLETMRLLKVDCLALGMLTCIRKCLHLLRDSGRRDMSLADLAATDRADDASARQTYAMICRADTIGVFQIESRAQMAMLPRLQPRCYYDLVIQVAIVRPGPIQGDMVHPYLLRRKNPHAVVYPSAELVRGAQAHPGRAAVPGTGDASWPSLPPGSRRAKPTNCAAAWPPGSDAAASSISTSVSSAACWGKTIRWNLPRPCSTSCAVSAATVFPNPTPPALPCSPGSAAG
jgi:hypothetical protein